MAVYNTEKLPLLNEIIIGRRSGVYQTIIHYDVIMYRCSTTELIALGSFYTTVNIGNLIWYWYWNDVRDETDSIPIIFKNNPDGYAKYSAIWISSPHPIQDSIDYNNIGDLSQTEV